MLKRNNRYIPRINNGSTHIYKAYSGTTLVFSNDDKREPCFAVVDDILTYTDMGLEWCIWPENQKVVQTQ